MSVLSAAHDTSSPILTTVVNRLVPTTTKKTVLVVFGGFAGTGKTTISSRLSSELGIPRLSSDVIRGVVQGSRGIADGQVNAGWVAYDVLFSVCEEFLARGVSAIVDTNLGWEFHWQWLDSIHERYGKVIVLPILLRCPLETCLERIRARHEQDPLRHAGPELYTRDKTIVGIWDFLSRLNRPDALCIDATRPLDDVYQDVRSAVDLQRRPDRRRSTEAGE
jgi:predicted kinase